MLRASLQLSFHGNFTSTKINKKVKIRDENRPICFHTDSALARRSRSKYNNPSAADRVYCSKLERVGSSVAIFIVRIFIVMGIQQHFSGSQNFFSKARGTSIFGRTQKFRSQVCKFVARTKNPNAQIFSRLCNIRGISLISPCTSPKAMQVAITAQRNFHCEWKHFDTKKLARELSLCAWKIHIEKFQF